MAWAASSDATTCHLCRPCVLISFKRSSFSSCDHGTIVADDALGWSEPFARMRTVYTDGRYAYARAGAKAGAEAGGAAVERDPQSSVARRAEAEVLRVHQELTKGEASPDLRRGIVRRGVVDDDDPGSGAR